MSLLRTIRISALPLFLSACAGLVVSSWSTESVAVGTRHFVLESGKHFKNGELEGVSVDSQGFLRAGLDLGALEVDGVDNVWAALEHEGALYLATGSEGKLVKVEGGKSEVVAKVDAMALTSITRAFGKTIVGTMPGGKLYELDGDKLVEFTELKEGAHIWGLSYDASQKTLYAATGPDGKLFRITSDGTAQVYFDAEQSHLVSVLAHQGKVYAGSSGEARLYEVTGPGRAKVLYDFSSTEVRGIAASSKGELVVIVNELKGGGRSDSISKGAPKGPRKSSSKSGSGKVYRFDKGQVEELHEDSSEHFVSLSLDEKDRPLLGTGVNGRVVRLEQNRQSIVLADVEERQVSRVILAGNKGWVVASDPVVVHPLEGVGGPDALWTSEVLDAGIRARFGKMSFDAEGKIELSTRSGNTEEPDETWTDWSAAVTKGGQVASRSGRYLQVRVRLVGGEKTELRRIDIPFVTDNLRAVLTEVKAKDKNSPSGSKGISSSGSPIDGKPSTSVKLSWKVDNPDDDTLRYRVEYRLESDMVWFDALEPGEVLKSTSHDWDTKDLPEGHYRVRVTASDELANPPGRVKRHQLQSQRILVDNTAPHFKKIELRGRTVSGVAQDGLGPIQRLELRASGDQEWIPFEPKDGIFDESREAFSFDLGETDIGEKALITVRAFDTAGNSVVQHLKPGAAAKR